MSFIFFARVGVTAKKQKQDAMLTPLLSVSPTAEALTILIFVMRKYPSPASVRFFVHLL